MSDSTPKIVITGIGSVCPLGIGTTALSDALTAGRSAVTCNDRVGHEYSQVRFVARIRDFEPSKLVKPRKSIKLMSETITTAVAAAAFAVDHAGLDVSTIDPTRMGVVCGSEMIYGAPDELAELYKGAVTSGEFRLSDFGRHFGGVFPLWLLKYLPNMPSCHIGIAHGATGHNNSPVQGDASSLLAIAEAATVIQRGTADMMLTGGTGTMLAECWTCNLSSDLFVQAADDPTQASRPFDAQRAGTVAGEGAGLLLLESAEHATARGATPLAELIGFSRVFHRDVHFHHGSIDKKGPEVSTSVEAIERSIQLALRDAGCTADDVDHVNAHATSRQCTDAREAQAIRNTLGDVPVTAIKSYFGNLGAGSGTIELAASIMGMQSGIVPPTLNFETPDPACPVNVIAGEPRVMQKPVFLKLSQSSTGQAAAVVLRKWE